ncbi:PREDICTED: 28S ribosomal protein S36, mitochondrial [Ceratosolen solmsi marchali]|uniref:28S ribosomal protein S36, mitochondrial n=1 Tax=Ceratosolen solmsi marchali TaxID=326594 RepID=A0AAJ6YBE4_9HYME|nr:PREDICTED: 28S ribosomal protein S36, mitochondrial [Ceratosolen solmsi marchali]
MASKGWKVVQAHVPMIRFRKGVNNRVAAVVAKSAPSGSGGVSANKPEGATGPNVVVLPIIDDFQLPVRFQRRPIDTNEIEYINRGGPE